MGVSPLIAILAGGLLATGCLAGAFYYLSHKRIIDDLPTSRTKGVFIGLAELKGTAESDSPLSSYLAASKCVHFNWKIEEHWRRTVTETYTDSKGHTQTRTRVESGWTNVAHGEESQPFYLKDETGIIRIIPDGAKIQGNVTFNDTLRPNDPLYYGKGPQKTIANSTHQRRFFETAVPLHSMLYVLGQAREREDIAAAEIAHDKQSPMFLISTHSEKQVSGGYNLGAWLFSLGGLLAVEGGGLWWALINGAGSIMEWQPFLIMGGSYLGVWVLTWVWTEYNSLINLHHRVEQGWSQVDVQLKRRHDLIPNLVQAVGAYRDYEKETQSVITALRGQMEATSPGKAGSDFSGMVPVLKGLVERYPDLKADQSFLRLQGSLVDTEQRIALARDYFNDIVTFYNTRLSVLPERYVAGLARLRPQVLMSAADFERAPVEVRLADD